VRRAPGPLVSILVVTYRKHELFGRCLASLLEATRGADVEIVVVVNSDRVEREHHDAEAAGAIVIRPGVNLGLAGGLQAARAAARGRYLLVTQEDVEVDPDWLAPLLEVFADDPSVGAVTSRVEHANGDLQHEGWIIVRDLSVVAVGDQERRGPRRAVDSGGTASLLVAADAWDAIGGPNIDLYPLWCVDVDLALSLARAGWNVMVEPRSRVRHRAHSSTSEGFRAYLSHRNGSRVARRFADEIARRPERQESPEFIAGQLDRCAREADLRRTQPRPTATPSPPPTMADLVRRARRQQWSVRLGYPVWRVQRRVRRLWPASSRGQ